MAYPTPEELQAFAINAGVVTAGQDLALDYGRVLASAINEFESATGWQPFISTTQTRVYDMPYPDGKILDFRAGILSISSFTISGTALTQGVDYVLYPLNAPNVGKPYSWCQFITRHVQWWPWTLPANVSITGQFGYASDCPADVKHGILCLACSDLIATKAGAATGGVNGIKQDDVEIRYSTHTNSSGLTPQQTQLTEAYNDIVKRYRRVRVF